MSLSPGDEMRSQTPSSSSSASDKAASVHPTTDEETASQSPTQTSQSDPLNLERRWDGPQDPDNPKNWPIGMRVTNALIIISVGMLSSFASSVLVPAIPDVMLQFGTTDSLIGTLTTSVYVLGLGFGPFILSPLSEMYGRWSVYTSMLAAFTVLQMGCALSNSMTLLIVLRFLAGLTGGVAPSLGQASMSDLWRVHNRGRWAAVQSMGPMLGPPLGNVMAALILSGKPWPWIFWVLMMFSGALLFASAFCLKETYAPVLLRRRQQKRLASLAFGSHNSDTSDTDVSQEGFNEKQVEIPDPAMVFGHAITRPLRFLATSPILVIFGFFFAYTYGMMYLLLTSLPLLFAKDQSRPGLFNYGFATIRTALSFLGLAIGLFLGLLVQIYAQTHIWNYLTKRHGEGRPEYRLLPMTVGMIFFPVSLLWYGWSATNEAHWIVPEIATGLFGLGMFITFQSIQVYLTEAFRPYSASALAAATLLRAITGAVFPLFGAQLFTHLGYGKAGTLLAAIALPAIPLPWILYKHGKYLRQRWDFKS